MGLKWVDSLDIAIELNDKFPDVDPMHVNFVDLRNWVLELDDLDDDPEHSGERILEAIRWHGSRKRTDIRDYEISARILSKHLKSA